MLGGLVRWVIEKRKYASDKERNDCVESGVLYTSGLIAGEGIVGILLAVLAVIKVGDASIGEIIDLSGSINLGNIGGLVLFAVLLASIFAFANKGKKK